MIRHPKLQSFIVRTARAARAAHIEEELVVALAAEWEITRAETHDRTRGPRGPEG